MADPVISTFNDLYQTGSDEVSIRAPKLTAREAGSVIDAVLGAASAIADEALVKILLKIVETFIDTAEKKALDKLAFDHFSLTRQAAVKAVGSLTLSRANTGAGTGQIPIGSRFTTAAGGSGNAIEFETTETKTITGLSVTVAAQAVLGGTSGNVAQDTINQVKSTLFDASITVTNPAKFVGGVEEESDPAFRDRIKGYLETLRRATPTAVVYGAKQTGGVVFANLDESTAGDGYITIYIADQDGNANAELISQVQAELENWRAAGITLNVSGATAVTQAIDFSPVFKAGVDTDKVLQDAITAVTNYRDGLDVGEKLYFSQLNKVIQLIDGIEGVTVNTPAGDVSPSANQIIRGGAVTTS